MLVEGEVPYYCPKTIVERWCPAQINGGDEFLPRTFVLSKDAERRDADTAPTIHRACNSLTKRHATRTLLDLADGSKLAFQQKILGRQVMGSWLSEREQRLVAGAETASAATPIPTQIVSNGEYLPPPQSETQKRV